MQTTLSPRFSELGKQAEPILRSCVHCGFCTATCPTYQLTGDELDGPRGRIYLIKALLEGEPGGPHTRYHLDRCLGCRACEVTCPSGVRYSRLLELGHRALAGSGNLPWPARVRRRLLRAVVPRQRLFTALLRTAQWVSRWLPGRFRPNIPPPQAAMAWPAAVHGRLMLLLESCAQAGATPATNAAAAHLLGRWGIRLERVREAGCCGALSHHLEAHDEARAMARRNIEAWWPYIEAGAEAVVITASGCGSQVKEYGELLADDPDYRRRATRIAALARDLSEVVAAEAAGRLAAQDNRGRVAFHAPCSLQHGQRLTGVVESLLTAVGYELTPVPDGHLCCGSAGPYSLLQPTLATALRHRKLDALHSGMPEVIATANVGCQLHLQAGTDLPVRHWVELLEEATRHSVPLGGTGI